MLNAFFAKKKRGGEGRGGRGRGEVEGKMFLIFEGLIKDND